MGSRRAFLKLVGGAGVIVAAAGTGFALTRTPTKALEPWTKAGSAYTEPRMRALSYGLLAPNPHNKQPWLADLSEPGVVTLACDLDRLLPHTDPPSRQITIGLGAFIELTRMAAAEEGIRVDVETFPEGVDEGALDSRPIARLTFVEGEGTPDPLFAHALNRHTDRGPYDTTRTVPDSALQLLKGAMRSSAVGHTTTDPALMATLKDIALRGWLVEWHLPRTRRESIEVMRIGKAEINANPDGIALDGAFLEALSIAGLLTRETLDDPTSYAFKSSEDFFKEPLLSSMGFFWVTTETNTRVDQLGVGSDWLRSHLAATSVGLSMHPLSQVLQEFPEMEAVLQRNSRSVEYHPRTHSNVWARRLS